MIDLMAALRASLDEARAARLTRADQVAALERVTADLASAEANLGRWQGIVEDLRRDREALVQLVERHTPAPSAHYGGVDPSASVETKDVL